MGARARIRKWPKVPAAQWITHVYQKVDLDPCQPTFPAALRCTQVESGVSMFRVFIVSVSVLLAASSLADAQSGKPVRQKSTPSRDLIGLAEMQDASGNKIGRIDLRETGEGVLIRVDIK